VTHSAFHIIVTVEGAFSLVMKRPEQKADHSFLSNTKVNDAWSFATTTPHTSSGYDTSKQG
jgi:hypothetical protein